MVLRTFLRFYSDINVARIVIHARRGGIKGRKGERVIFFSTGFTDKVKRDPAIRESRWRLEKDTRSIHRMHAITSRRCGSFDMHRAYAWFCFRSESERKRASLRFQARREHKVNPIARSTLITLLSLIARKSRRIDRGCKTLIGTELENLERFFSLHSILKVFSISHI